jgi:hypothetical protein
MQKKVFFATGIIMLMIAAMGIYKVTKPHQNVSGQQAVATLTASSLYEDFAKTEKMANKKWVGKVLEISGTISAIEETVSYYAVSLRATPEGGVNCSIMKKDLDRDIKLNKGDSITIKGKCTGLLMDVNMVDCIIIK